MTTISEIYNQILNTPTWVIPLLSGWMLWKIFTTLRQKSVERFAQKQLGLENINLEPSPVGEKNDFLSNLDLAEQQLLNKIYRGEVRDPDRNYRKLASEELKSKTSSASPSQNINFGMILCITAGVIGIIIGIIQIGFFYGFLPVKL
jgi:hypothetical protein